MLPGHCCSLGEAAGLADWLLSFFLVFLFFFFVIKKGLLYGQKFSGLTDEKSGFALIWSKQVTERWEKNSVFALSLGLCKTPNPCFAQRRSNVY